MIVKTNNLFTLIEKHGCQPNDMRHFVDDLEEFFEVERLRQLLHHPVVKRYKKWKENHPDEEYRYDEIFEFTANLSRGEMCSLFERIEELSK